MADFGMCVPRQMKINIPTLVCTPICTIILPGKSQGSCNSSESLSFLACLIQYGHIQYNSGSIAFKNTTKLRWFLSEDCHVSHINLIFFMWIWNIWSNKCFRETSRSRTAPWGRNTNRFFSFVFWGFCFGVLFVCLLFGLVVCFGVLVFFGFWFGLDLGLLFFVAFVVVFIMSYLSRVDPNPVQKEICLYPSTSTPTSWDENAAESMGLSPREVLGNYGEPQGSSVSYRCVHPWHGNAAFI